MRVVLLAADQSLMTSLMSLLETRGHDVVGFAEVNQALAHLETHMEANAFIIVEAPIKTPGPEICWEARLLASFERPIYICLISRPLSSQAFIEALDCGADDVLQMPLSSDELYARLRAADRVNQIQLKLFEMATHDGLTGLLNRPAFFHRATKRCDEAKAPLAAIMIDIDHFKAVNDTYGHAGGDKAIRAVAECLKSQSDLVGRLGGEEFALLLDHGDAGQAWSAAEALRREIASREIIIDGAELRLSCSFGVAVGEMGEDIDAILRKADAALYAAKHLGRNIVALHDPEKAPLPPAFNSIIRGAVQPAAVRHRRVAS
jgi:two-component system, cell cycle response regulator